MELYEHLDKILYIISSVITVLIGANGILFYRINHGLKKTQLQREQSDEWKRLFDEKEDECDDLRTRMNELYKQRLDIFNENTKLKVDVSKKDVEIAKKDIELIKLKYYRCIVDDCDKRQPKRSYRKNTEQDEQAFS